MSAMVAAQLGAWRSVGREVWVAVAEPDSVNLVLIAGADTALLIDTGSTHQQGAQLRSAAAEQLPAGVNVSTVLITHAHRDHILGLAAFDDLVTIAHESVADDVRSDELRAHADALGVKAAICSPNTLIAAVTAIDLGGRRVEILHPGRGHTAGDLVAFVPDADLVMVGDLAEQSAPVSYGSDSWPQEWPATLDVVIGLTGPATTILVGHGDPISREELIRTRAEVSAVATEIESLISRGVALERAYDEGQWPYPAERIEAGIAADYARAQDRPGQAGRTILPLISAPSTPTTKEPPARAEP